MDDQVPVGEAAAETGGFARILFELRQQHVFRAAATYGVVSWLLVQVVATVGPAFDSPAWVLRAVVLAAIVGFLATMAFMLFRPRSGGKGRLPTYLSPRARLIAAAGVLLVAALAATFSVRSLNARQQVSLAVLPFDDLSPTRDKAYFAEGVAEEILSTLAGEKGIKVLGRASARQIGRNSDPKTIRASLGITHLLEGSTRTSGNALRVNVRLIDTSDGSQMWEEEYQGALSDIFKVQDSIASTVVRRVRGTFFNQSVRPAAPTAIDAYETYLAARAIIRENKAESIKRAWTMARQIVAAHPDYAPGHALLAETTMLLTDGPYGYGGVPRWKGRQIALPHAREAIRLAPNRAEGYAALGLLLPYEDAIAAFRQALKLDPSRSDVRLRLGLAFDATQQPDKAFKQYKLVAEMDPLAPAMINRYIQMLASSGHTDEALRFVDKFAERGGSSAQAWRFRGAVYGYVTDFSRSIIARKRALRIDPGLPYQHDWIVQTLHLLGLDDQSAPYRAGANPYLQLFVADDRGALKERLARNGAAAWEANGVGYALFSLGRAKDWPTIARFYDIRSGQFRDYCQAPPELSWAFVLALQHKGRRDEANRLLKCKDQQIARLLRLPVRSPDLASGELEMLKASLLAARDDRGALDWLEKAVQRGWVGQYSSSQLADYPQFDGFRSDPRYTALQKRIDATIARERAEFLAGR